MPGDVRRKCGRHVMCNSRVLLSIVVSLALHEFGGPVASGAPIRLASESTSGNLPTADVTQIVGQVTI